MPVVYFLCTLKHLFIAFLVYNIILHYSLTKKHVNSEIQKHYLKLEGGCMVAIHNLQARFVNELGTNV